MADNIFFPNDESGI